MASTSGEQVIETLNYRSWLDESSNGNETSVEKSSVDLDGIDVIVGPSITTSEPLEPYIGMEFDSADDARIFYEMYGRRVGFSIRNSRVRRSERDNSIIARQFVCSKEGFRVVQPHKRGKTSSRSRPETREGCHAMLKIAARGGGKWVIYGFIKEHSHELSPNNIPQRRSQKPAFYEDEKDLKIRQLSAELHQEKKKTAAYQEQLLIVLNHVEEHTRLLSLKLDEVAKSVQELESGNSMNL